MTHAVSMLLADKTLRDELGKHARDYSRQFTWVGTTQHWETLLHHVTRRGAPITMTDARSEIVRR